MPDTNEDHKTEESRKTENHVNGDAKPEEPQENQDTDQNHLVNVDEVIDEDFGHTGSL